MDWSIGVYSGSTPFDLAPARDVTNPVLASDQVTDVGARFVADPFMIQVQGRWWMFFEIMESARPVGCIGAAESEDGLHWIYRGVVLREDFHLSYPFVFGWQGSVYMVPETLAPGQVLLYCAESFPRGWTCVGSLVEGSHADPTPFRHGGRWWLFTCVEPYRHDRLALFHSDSLLGPWHEHPASPVVVGDARIGRPAGRLVQYDGRLFRLAQDGRSLYGESVEMIEIETLDPRTYKELRCPQSPILEGSGAGWNGRRMHHLDAHRLGPGRWLACVDGSSC